jgi:hypothetical protein
VGGEEDEIIMAEKKEREDLGTSISTVILDAFILTFSLLSANTVSNLIMTCVSRVISPEKFSIYLVSYLLYPDALGYIISDIFNSFISPEETLLYFISTLIFITITVFLVYLRFRTKR